MDKLLSEFNQSINIEKVALSECPSDKLLDIDKLLDVETKSHDDTKLNDDHTQKTRKINDVSVDQTWVERAITFANAYVDLVSNDQINKEFKSSEFENLSDFLNYNQIYLVKEQYYKVANQVTILKRSLVDQCYQKWNQTHKGSLSDFLSYENISQLNNCYFRSTPSFSKYKLLEIILELPFDQLSIGNINESQFIDFLTLTELFVDEQATLKIMVMGSSVGYWKLIDPENLMPNIEFNLRKYFTQIQMGIEINISQLYGFQQFIQLILDNMTIK